MTLCSTVCIFVHVFRNCQSAIFWDKLLSMGFDNFMEELKLSGSSWNGIPQESVLGPLEFMSYNKKYLFFNSELHFFFFLLTSFGIISSLAFEKCYSWYKSHVIQINHKPEIKIALFYAFSLFLHILCPCCCQKWIRTRITIAQRIVNLILKTWWFSTLRRILMF